MCFDEIKREYTHERQLQKNEIINVLKANGFKILRRDGKPAIKTKLTGTGVKRYTAVGTISTYDLSNWMWIYARNEKQNFDVLISLQSYNIDEETGNTLVLMDRIGVYKHCVDGYDKRACFEEMVDTGIDLPICENNQCNEKMDRLLEIISKIGETM